MIISGLPIQEATNIKVYDNFGFVSESRITNVPLKLFLGCTTNFMLAVQNWNKNVDDFIMDVTSDTILAILLNKD